MRELTREEKERLRAKIQEERKRQHEAVMETARESDKEDIEERRRLGSLIELFEPGLSLKRRLILILALLLSALLPIIAFIVIKIIFRSLISMS